MIGKELERECEKERVRKKWEIDSEKERVINRGLERERGRKRVRNRDLERVRECKKERVRAGESGQGME